MEQIRSVQTLRNSSYGNLICYGYICNLTKEYLINMSKSAELQHKHSDIISLMSVFGEYPKNKVAPAYKDWGYFLCIQSQVFDKFISACNGGRFKDIASFAVQNQDITFAITVILKLYELTRSGKKNIFCIKFGDKLMKKYGFWIEKEVFDTLSNEFNQQKTI